MSIIGIIVSVFFIILLIGSSMYVGKEERHAKEERLEEEKQKENNKEHRYNNNIPDNANLCGCTNITVKEKLIDGKWKVFIWKDSDILYFCGETENDGIRKTAIPVKVIKFYARKGDYRVESVTEGGGTNFLKAILIGIISFICGKMIGGFIDIINFNIFSSGIGTILGVLFFVLGALLGGRNKTITKNIKIDNRKTYFNYLENNQNRQIIFSSRTYEVLSKLVPEKEIDYVGSTKSIESDSIQKNDNNDIYKDIEKLAGLKEKGIITEEEFNQKKQLLLDKIQ